MREALSLESLKAIIKPIKSQSLLLSPFTQNSKQRPWWSFLPSAGGHPPRTCLTPPAQQCESRCTSCTHFLNPKCHGLAGVSPRNYFSPCSGSKKSKIKVVAMLFLSSLCLHMVSPPCVSLFKFPLLRGTPVMSDWATKWPNFNLIVPLKTLPPPTVTCWATGGLGLQCMKYRGGDAV